MRDAGMGFGSILDLRESPFREKPRPVFLQDLNLDQVYEVVRYMVSCCEPFVASILGFRLCHGIPRDP